MAYQINQAFCSCCHRCKIVCPVGAVRFRDGKYWIDPELCVDCGQCAKNCHNCVITRIGEVPPPAPAHERRQLDCDLVIAGAGGSGLVAAVKAAREGRRVIVVEKSRRPGGNTWYASGFGAHYSKLQKEAGIPDKRDEQLSRFLMQTMWREDPQLVYRVFQATEHFLDWLMEECGCEEDFVLGKNPPGDIVPVLRNKTGTHWERLDTSIGPGGAGSFVVEKMLAMAEKLGVQVLTQHEAVRLLTDDSGAVTGLEVRDPGGETEIRAEAVVLATGCFSYNEELLKKTCPQFFLEGEPVHRFSVPTCTGDGIRMASEIGAGIDYENTQALVLGPAHHPYAFSLVCIVRESEVVMVDREGRRFASEQDNCMSMRTVFQDLPGGYCYAILDSKLMDDLAQRLIERGQDGPDGVKILQKYKQDLEEEIALGKPVRKADTFRALARQMGVPEEAFEAQMERYNQMCRQGRDMEFFKDPRFLVPLDTPPYYAVYCKKFQENAVGGMKINADLQVLDTKGVPIPGLYAVGDNTRGVRVGGDLGPDLVERTISNLTWCFASGYMAGEQIARRLERKP